MLNYNIDRKTDTIRAILTVKNLYLKDRWYDKKSYIGIARVHPSDEYDEQKGMDIAKKRALKAFYKDTLLQLNRDLENITKTYLKLSNKKKSTIKKIEAFDSEIKNLTK